MICITSSLFIFKVVARRWESSEKFIAYKDIFHKQRGNIGRKTSIGFLKEEGKMTPIAPTAIPGGGGSSIVKVPWDVPPAKEYFFGLLA